jgi:hypothetical protein
MLHRRTMRITHNVASDQASRMTGTTVNLTMGNQRAELALPVASEIGNIPLDDLLRCIALLERRTVQVRYPARGRQPLLSLRRPPNFE